MVKIPAGALEAIPLFPLTRKYRTANYTLEGISSNGKLEVDGGKFATGEPPPFSEEDRQKEACEHKVDDADAKYKYGSNGRKLSIGKDGKWNIGMLFCRHWRLPRPSDHHSGSGASGT